MTKYIGEVTLVKTNIETGEVTEHTQRNTQLLGLFRNLYEFTSAPNLITNTSQSVIYITDYAGPFTRLTYDTTNTSATFTLGGAAISGEYWPQYLNETELNRASITFKQRFAPGTTARVINTISLYGPAWGQSIAALALQTPCHQSTLEILDIYYKIYVHYDELGATPDYNINEDFNRQWNIVPRWFYSSQAYLYEEGTSTNIVQSGAWIPRLYVLPVDYNLNYFPAGTDESAMTFATSTWHGYSITPSLVVRNNSQGSSNITYDMGISTYVGAIFNKIAIPRWVPSMNSGWMTAISASYILGESDSRIQSVYLKSADSADTNFAYLDPSTIGSSTATLTLNDSGWTSPWRPSMFKINITQGGNMDTAKYTVSMRNSFGFRNNFLSTENPIPLNVLFRRTQSNLQIYESNTFNGRGGNIKRINEREVVTSSPTGFTVSDVYLGGFVNYDKNSTPSIDSYQIQDAIPMPDGGILITTLDKGLLKLSPDRTVISQFTGIGAGVSENICYAAAVKFNGDIWAVFEGGLARYTSSSNSWVVYNSSTPISFTASTYNPNWSNTLGIYCRKDDGADEIALCAYSTNAITWWSPASPTAVVTSGGATARPSSGNTNFRADFAKVIMNVPGSSTWYFQNSNNTFSKMTFGTNSASIVGVGSTGSYKFAVMMEVMKNDEWMLQVVDNTSSTKMRWYNASGFVVDEPLLNSTITINGSNMVQELMDEYGTAIVGYHAGTYLYQAWLYNLINPLSSNSWRNYGWNDITNEWELGNTNAKPVHATMDELPDGLKCSFTPTGLNDFITNERWVGYVTDGLHKDNSTTATIGTTIQARNYYYTSDLSANVVPASLGLTTEIVSAYTLDNNNAHSWNGAVTAVGYSSSAAAAGLLSELIVDGDFEFSFRTNSHAQTTNTSNTICYLGMYPSDDLTQSSKWSFRFNASGYTVTENDTVRGTLVPNTEVHKYTIQRTGDIITYLVDDVLFYTSTVTSTGPMRVIMRMPPSDNNRTFYDMSITYNETRPAVRVGDLVNQTGVYDSRYAMVEAWMDSPRTASISLDGVPAIIVTDPKTVLVPGQVLLLQKSGLLVFHPSDVGKSIESNIMVLLET